MQAAGHTVTIVDDDFMIRSDFGPQKVENPNGSRKGTNRDGRAG